jgi:hypothetical protein
VPPAQAADTNAAIDFLRALAPAGPWALTFILPDGGTTTRTFYPGKLTVERDMLGEQAAWIAVERNQWRLNAYYHLNEVRAPISSKASKADVGRAVALHVDLDPRAGFDLAGERAAIFERLEAFSPPPSVVVDSGAGFQALWLLEKPFVLGRDVPEDVLAVEDRNRWLEKQLGGDHCHNVDRVLRLPGTANMPNRKKRAAGRVPSVARLLRADWNLRYDMADFPALPAELVPGPVALPTAAPPPDLAPRLLPDWALVLIRTGDAARWDGDRSAAVFAAACELVRAGKTDPEIAALLSDPANGIAAHVLDQSKPERYAARQAVRARAFVLREAGAAVRLRNAARVLLSERSRLEAPDALRAIRAFNASEAVPLPEAALERIVAPIIRRLSR